MHQAHHEITCQTGGPGLTDITGPILEWLAQTGVEQGLLTVFCRHTSASLVIQENADPDVVRDLADFFHQLVSRDPAHYRHTTEGPDDMPAHIRSALTQTQLSIPIKGGRAQLGTWQGLYLFEHRDRPHARSIALHVIGE
jgi:secondary thiamine-phosphate synthase enzyme